MYWSVSSSFFLPGCVASAFNDLQICQSGESSSMVAILAVNLKQMGLIYQTFQQLNWLESKIGVICKYCEQTV